MVIHSVENAQLLEESAAHGPMPKRAEETLGGLDTGLIAYGTLSESGEPQASHTALRT
jgi:hypothetical protein